MSLLSSPRKALDAMSPSWPSTFLVTRPSRIRLRGEWCLAAAVRFANTARAGCDFSAISGADANALRWDRLGYTQLTQLEAADGEKAFIKRTPSIEYWDDHISSDKIKTMSEYLEDVSSPGSLPVS